MPRLFAKSALPFALPAILAVLWAAPLHAQNASTTDPGFRTSTGTSTSQTLFRGRIDPEDEESRDGDERDREGERRRATEESVQDEGPLQGPGAIPDPQTLRKPDETNFADQSFVEQQQEDDPYAALGIRVGSFLLFPELSVDSVYTDNLFLSTTNTEGDWALELTPLLRMESDWARHSLSGSIGGLYSFHDRFPGEDDETFEASLAGRFDIRSRTTVGGGLSYSEGFEDRSSTDFPANSAERPRTTSTAANLEGNHTINRVKLTLRGDWSEEEFGDSVDAQGAIINNDDRDYEERRVTGRVAYEFQPGVSVFAQTSANERIFAEAFDDDGTRNGSSGYDVQGGLAFQLTGKLTGEASAGYAVQEADDTSLKDVDGLIFNAALEYRATALTTFRLDASSQVEETTTQGSAGTLERNVEISVEHRPRRNIILGAAFGYEQDTFAGSNQEDEEWSLGLSGEYLFSRTVALTIKYEHEENWSSAPGQDYEVDTVRMGVRLRR